MVLIVEDHKDSAELLRRVLSRKGVHAEVALGGAEALSLARTNRPTVVVMDEMMPEMNGLEVVRLMRQDPQLSDVNVIFYSANYDWRKQQTAEALGAKAWLVKGVVRLAEVVDVISKYVPSKGSAGGAMN
jgi:CheY-like chemotaxis protein